jgi:hypothetical protein
MTSAIKLLQILDWDSPRQNARLREELAAGLLQPQAAIAPKFFYDALGSRLFEAITELPEYYPTRTEAAIFDEHLPEIRRVLGADFSLIDLGCGSCAKAGRLFHAGVLPARYVAVDISVDFLRDSLQNLKRELPAIDMTGLGLDFTDELRLPDDLPPERRMFFYPGSSIGNFSPRRGRRLPRPAGGTDGRQRRTADRGRPDQGQGAARCRLRRSRWASPPPSTATCCATSMPGSMPTFRSPTGSTWPSSTRRRPGSKCTSRRGARST